MIISRGHPRALLAFIVVLVVALLLMADCQRDDRTRPDPGYDPDRNGGLWLDGGNLHP